MLLGFKRQFEPYVLDGSKTHTVRARRKIRPRVGQRCDCYGDVRQKTMHLLGRWPCVRVESIKIANASTIDLLQGDCPLRVWIEGSELSAREVELFFIRDGFRNHPDPDLHWAPVCLAAAFWFDRLVDGPWEGDLIHWDYSKPMEKK